MDRLYLENLDLLLKKQLTTKNIKEILECEEANQENVVIEQGIIYYIEKKEKIQLNSCFTEQEVKLYTRNISFQKDNLIIVFGIANIDLLQYLLLNISAGTRVVIMEPSESVTKFILSNFELSHIWNSNKFHLLVGEHNENYSYLFNSYGLGWDNLSKNIQVVSNPNYCRYAEYKVRMIKQLTEIMNTTIKSLGNSLEDNFEGFRNNYLNIEACMESSNLDDIVGKYQGYPAIIVASGPSLDKNIKYLKEAQEKALIISCDASYNACRENEVTPDAIASIERVPLTYEYYYKDHTFDEDLVLVGPAVLWPEIYKEFKGKKIVLSKDSTGIENWWHKHFEQTRFLSQGFSCANVAFATAVVAGCNPIILLGQDLAYTDEKIHSDSTHTEYEGENKADKRQELWVEDVYGKPVRTSSVYNLFRVWFETQIAANPKIKVIDATQGGAKIKGTQVMDLEQAIKSYCTDKIPKHMHEYLSKREYTQEEKIELYQSIINDAEEQIKNIRIVQNRARRHFETVEKLSKKNIAELSQTKLIEVIEKMQKGDKIIQFIKNKNQEISIFYEQIIKQSIIQVKANGNEITPENIWNNMKIQLNLMYMICNSSIVIIQEYEKLIKYLNMKIVEMEN